MTLPLRAACAALALGVAAGAGASYGHASTSEVMAVRSPAVLPLRGDRQQVDIRGWHRFLRERGSRAGTALVGSAGGTWQAAVGEANPWFEARVAPRVRGDLARGARALRVARLRAARLAEAKRQRAEAARAAARAAAARAAAVRDSGGLIVGDSVALGAESCLTGLGYRVNAKVGRQFATGLTELRKHAAAGLPDAVVVHLGTNGPFGESGFREVMALLGSHVRVVWVTIALPDRPRYAFEASLNDMIRALAPSYPNARIADWNRASGQNRGWLYGDGIHIGGAGCTGFAVTVDSAVRAP